MFAAFRLLFALQSTPNRPGPNFPHYVLDYVSCSELDLKKHLLRPAVHSAPQFAKHCESREYVAANQLKILDLNEFDDILVDLDRYVKDAKKRAVSPVHVFMKTHRLSSLVHSKPSDETTFRFMDIRLRVYLYDAMCRFVASVGEADTFYKSLNASGLGEQREHNFEATPGRMQHFVSKTQRCVQLAVYDTLLKNDWSDAEILTPAQVDCLEKWVHLANGEATQTTALPRTFNMALYNRLLDLKTVFADYTLANNPVLRDLTTIASASAKENESLALQSATEFDPHLKTIVGQKVRLMIDSWDQEFLNANNDKLESKSQAAQQLLSLKLTLKYCQAIRVMQRHFQTKNDTSLVEQKIRQPAAGDIHLLAPLTGPTIERIETEASRGYLRYFMSKILMTHCLQNAKAREMREVLLRFKDMAKKDQDVAIKNTEYDHLVAQNVNFCKMAAMLSNQKAVKLSATESPELNIDQATVTKYFAKTADASFLFPNRALLETNLAGLFSEVTRSIIEAQIKTFQLASLNVAVKKIKRKPQQPVVRKDNLASSIMASNESKLLPFVVNFLASFVGKSYNLVTNKDEECYIINREDFLDIMVVLLRESGAYAQKTSSVFRDHYLTSYIHALYSRVVSTSSLMFLKRHFLLLVKDFHKLVEGQLAEKNFGVVYELDKLAKFAKYAIYDGSMILDKLRESVSVGYTETLNAVNLEGQDIKSRSEAFAADHLPLKILEFNAQVHTANMASLREKAGKVLEDDVAIVDAATRQSLAADDLKGKLV